MLKVAVISRVPGLPEDPFEGLRVRVFNVYLTGLDRPEMQAFQDFLASGNIFSSSTRERHLEEMVSSFSVLSEDFFWAARMANS